MGSEGGRLERFFARAGCGRGLLALGLAGATSPGAEALRSAQPAECMPGASDYTLLWWAHGWDKHAPLRPQLLCLQTGCYGLALDVEKLGLLHFGSIASPKPYEAVAREDHDFIARLPKGRLELIARVGEKAYRCTRAATNQRDSMNFPVRMIENGRCAQRFDVLQLQFTDATGASLAAEGRLEVVAWPDRLCLLVELTPSSDLADASLGISLAGEGKDTPAKTARSAGARWEAGKPQTVALVYEFHGANGVPAGCVSATDASRTNALLEVGFDEARGWHRIVLPAWRGAIAQDADPVGPLRPHTAEPRGRGTRGAVALRRGRGDSRHHRLHAHDPGHPRQPHWHPGATLQELAPPGGPPDAVRRAVVPRVRLRAPAAAERVAVRVRRYVGKMGWGARGVARAALPGGLVLEPALGRGGHRQLGASPSATSRTRFSAGAGSTTSVRSWSGAWTAGRRAGVGRTQRGGRRFPWCTTTRRGSTSR